MNQGALFFDRFELFIHDFNDPIQGPIARFTPSFAQKNFQCEDLESRQRVRNIMYGFQPYGSFMTKFKSKQQVLEDFMQERGSRDLSGLLTTLKEHDISNQLEVY